MRTAGGDSWNISTSTDPNIEFTVWALKRDGLHAGAFNAHPDGDGRLRGAGLTEEDWLKWFESMVRARTAQHEALRGDPTAIHRQGTGAMDPLDLFFAEEPPTAEQINRYREDLLARTAAGMFRGPNEVGALLLKQWPEYLRYDRVKADREFQGHVALHAKMTEEEAESRARRGKAFWDQLQAYRPLPPLHVYLVEYPKPVLSVVPPASLVIGLIDPSEEDLPDYSPMVFEGARQLKQLW